MASRENSSLQIVPGSSLPIQPWWPDLHAMIIAAFKKKDVQAFPPSWTRLDANSRLGAEGLAKELGEEGILVAAFLNSKPVACSGVLPFRGEDWINDVKSAESEANVANGELTKANPETAFSHLYESDSGGKKFRDWEICCFCVHPDHRYLGLSRLILTTLIDLVRSKGAEKLVTNYSIEETGDYWPSMGFKNAIGKGSIVKKGWTHTAGMEGLREDLHFRMSAMELT